jgi:hypothetical protein
MAPNEAHSAYLNNAEDYNRATVKPRPNTALKQHSQAVKKLAALTISSGKPEDIEDDDDSSGAHTASIDTHKMMFTVQQ